MVVVPDLGGLALSLLLLLRFARSRRDRVSLLIGRRLTLLCASDRNLQWENERRDQNPRGDFHRYTPSVGKDFSTMLCAVAPAAQTAPRAAS
jgi:hypothetical protein